MGMTLTFSLQLFPPTDSNILYFSSVGKLMEMHGEGAAHSSTDESGTKIERDSFEPPVQESV